MLPQIKDYFHFNRRERRGVFILCIIIIFQLLFLSFDQFIYTNNEQITDADRKKFEELKELFKEDSAKTDYKREVYHKKVYAQYEKKDKWSGKKAKNREKKVINVEYFKFNPNIESRENLLKLGLKKWQVSTIEKYRSKGGVYRVKKDLGKMYNISDSLYVLLEPYIDLPDTLLKKRYVVQKKLKKEKETTFFVQMNASSEEDWMKLKGIGKVYSSRIVKYKKKLGGFVHQSQLKEVYGLSDELYEQIKDKIVLDSIQVKKVNINKLSAYNMSRHPYITWNLANLIESTRKEEGEFSSVYSLKASGLLNAELYSKIAPYITTEE